MRAVLIPVTKKVEVVEIPDGEGQLAALQAHVGGYIETVRLHPVVDFMGPAKGIVNEEGLLLDLPVNVWATFLSTAEVIAGPMLVVGLALPEFVDVGEMWCDWALMLNQLGVPS